MTHASRAEMEQALKDVLRPDLYQTRVAGPLNLNVAKPKGTKAK